MKFTVLMSIYHNENPLYFDRAMQSIWNDQITKPNEIVLVQDGPLTRALYQSINKWKEILGSVFKIISLEGNVGLGDALNAGLQNCTNELVARMDTDDIATSDRFSRQLPVFKHNDIDVCGSWVGEFDNDESQIISCRKLPETHSEIILFSKRRNPINHPSVMYKKSAVKKAGGYQKVMWFEDYHLWARMILSGAKFYNIQQSLVNMRAGHGQLERRSGLKYAMSEVKLQRELLGLGFIGFIGFLDNTLLRFFIRIMPKSIIRPVYQLIRKI